MGERFQEGALIRRGVSGGPQLGESFQEGPYLGEGFQRGFNWAPMIPRDVVNKIFSF